METQCNHAFAPLPSCPRCSPWPASRQQPLPSALLIGNATISINNREQVTGISALPGSLAHHAFLWTRATGMRDLGTLPGDLVSAGLIDATVPPDDRFILELRLSPPFLRSSFANASSKLHHAFIFSRAGSNTAYFNAY